MLEENIQIFESKIIGDEQEKNSQFSRAELMNQYCHLIDVFPACLTDALIMSVDSSCSVNDADSGQGLFDGIRSLFGRANVCTTKRDPIVGEWETRTSKVKMIKCCFV